MGFLDYHHPFHVHRQEPHVHRVNLLSAPLHMRSLKTNMSFMVGTGRSLLSVSARLWGALNLGCKLRTLTHLLANITNNSII